MSWKDKLENSQFTIETGDGKVFKPLWKSGGKSKDFNSTIFDFIEVEGSFVDRKKAKSAKYSLIFWFQGEDNIEQAEAFETSANDSRAWTVKHPFYGTLKGQPLSLERDDSNLNVTQVTVEFWESITNQFPRKKVAPLDSLQSKGLVHSNSSAQIYASKTELKPVDQAIVKQNVTNFSLKYDTLLDDVNYAQYQESLSKALQSVDEIITGPVQAIKDINTLISLPSEFQKSIQQRLNLLYEIYKDAKDVLGITPNRNNKSYFEATGGAVISSIASAVLNPFTGDYVTRMQVQDIALNFINLYNDYLTTLDAAQVQIEDINNSFSIGFQGQANLNSIVTECLANLYQLAFDSKQERIVQVDKDTNLILLTHKYMGLDSLDENIEKFRTINNIKNKSLFVIKKGRQIKYFV